MTNVALSLSRVRLFDLFVSGSPRNTLEQVVVIIKIIIVIIITIVIIIIVVVVMVIIIIIITRSVNVSVSANETRRGSLQTASV